MEWKDKYPKDNKPGEKELLDFFPPHIRDLFITFDHEMNERFKVKNRINCAEHRFKAIVGWVFGYGRNYGCKLLEVSINNDHFCVLRVNVKDDNSLQKALEEAQKKYDDGYEERFAARSAKLRKGQNDRAKMHSEGRKKKEPLTEDTVVVFGQISSAEYKKYFIKVLGDDYEKHADAVNYNVLWNKHIGKTLKEVVDECLNLSSPKSLDEILSERRFNTVSESDKAFITAFNDAMNKMGYDYGDGIGTAIKYCKTGTKTRTCPAHIEIGEIGINLRLFLTKIDDHRQYVENTPAHIKDGFVFTGGDCKSCHPICAPGKIYTIDGQLMQKCKHATFRFNKPTVEKLPDYMGLLEEFYPVKTQSAI